MATPPDSPIEEEVVLFELETTARAPKPIPVALEDLCRLTKFTRQEIRVMYRGFKTVRKLIRKARMGRCSFHLPHTNHFRLFRLQLFRQECPEGVVHEDCFKDIYAKFFPHGSKFRANYWLMVGHMPNERKNKLFFSSSSSLFCFTRPCSLNTSDSSIYAHYVFRAFDVNSNGAISFRVSFSNLSHIVWLNRPKKKKKKL